MITRQVPWSIHVLVTMKLYPRNCIRYNSVRHGKRNGSVVITVSIKGLGPNSLMTGSMMYHYTNLGNLREGEGFDLIINVKNEQREWMLYVTYEKRRLTQKFKYHEHSILSTVCSRTT